MLCSRFHLQSSRAPANLSFLLSYHPFSPLPATSFPKDTAMTLDPRRWPRSFPQPHSANSVTPLLKFLLPWDNTGDRAGSGVMCRGESFIWGQGKDAVFKVWCLQDEQGWGDAIIRTTFPCYSTASRKKTLKFTVSSQWEKSPRGKGIKRPTSSWPPIWRKKSFFFY